MLGLPALVAILAGSGCDVRGGPGERIRGEGFELRCDPGCGPDGRALVADLGRTRDSVVTWFGAGPAVSAGEAGGRSGQSAGQGAGQGAGRDPRLRVRLYASPAAFLRADRRLASGRFADQRAFSHERSRSAHILAEGAPDPYRWQRFGPGFQGERLAVHEAAHLASYALAVDPRWPSWVSEGIASHAEERWAGSRSRVQEGRADEPWLHTQRYTRQRLLQNGDLPGIDAVLRGELGDLSLGTRYAVWGGWMGVLLDPPFRDVTRTFLAELAEPPPAGGWSRREVTRRFEAHFDEEARAALDLAFRSRVAGESADWVEVRRSAGWTREGLLQLPVGEDPFLWRPAHPGSSMSAFGLRAAVEVLGPGGGSGSGQVILALGVDGWTEEAVGVRVSRGGVPELVRVSLGGDGPPVPWREASVVAPAPAPTSNGDSTPAAASAFSIRRNEEAGGAILEVEVTLVDGVFTARVGGRSSVAWSMEGLRATGGWGVGTGGGGAALWRELVPRIP